MARPRKWRCVEGPAGPRLFKPAGVPARELERVLLTLDGLEVLRLLDLEGRTQEEAALHLGVSRSTVSRLAAEARGAVADALVGGKALAIEGGPVAIAQQRRVARASSLETDGTTNGGESMVIAVPYLDGRVNAHFGQTQAFLIAEAEDGALQKSTVYTVAGLEHNHSGLAGFLAERGVDVILAGGMGAPMQQALTRAGFDLYCGVSGPANEAVEAFLGGEIAKSEATCGHHHGAAGHDDGGAGHAHHEGGCSHH
ncbi:MAG: DUF134 domain-containing protein [Thermoleophilia bacterium]